MAKRLSEEQKKIIINSFKDGETIENLSREFNCTKITIIRNLKKSLGENIYKEYFSKNGNSFPIKDINESSEDYNTIFSKEEPHNDLVENMHSGESTNQSISHLVSEFIEISPLNIEIENTSRKEYSSIPIEEIELPKIVYIIVDKNTELEIKFLKDYPDWEFLPNEDLKRKTIEIFLDLKTAKRFCTKEKKVIKVPNTDVFKIVSPILMARGISRIISDKKLIAL